jgi:thiamine biosynthesis protein ThiI
MNPKFLIIARYGELHLKGKNRAVFTNALTRNLRAAVSVISPTCNVKLQDGRYTFDNFLPQQKAALVDRIKNVFGLTSVSVAAQIRHCEILDYVKQIPVSGTFRVNVTRADKNFPETSMQFAKIAGAAVLAAQPSAAVNLHTPDQIINIDIRENDIVYVYENSVAAVGGLPVGTAGHALVLLSGGIDSPVAAYLAAKRGLVVQAVHFESPPYTNAQSLDKVQRLTLALEPFCGPVKLHVVSVTEILREIKKKCHPNYTITLLRRHMVRESVRIAAENHIDCLVTGENLAQVASQTIQGITVTNAAAGTLPILRPLITNDKSEIIALARQIGTYEISIEPHSDCCTVFVPESPVIAPKLNEVLRQESKLALKPLE